MSVYFLIGTLLWVPSTMFAGQTSFRAAAVSAFESSALVSSEIERKCNGDVLSKQNAIAIILSQGDVGDRFEPVLVAKEIGCRFASINVAAIVETRTRIGAGGGFTYETKSPVLVDLDSLVKQ